MGSGGCRAKRAREMPCWTVWNAGWAGQAGNAMNSNVVGVAMLFGTLCVPRADTQHRLNKMRRLCVG